MNEEQRITRVINEYKQPVSITLTKGAKGFYRWTIDVKAESADEALTLVKQMDLELNRTFTTVASSPPNPEKARSSAPQNPHSKMDQALRNIKKARENPINVWEAGK